MSIFWMLRNTSTLLCVGPARLHFTLLYCKRELFYQFVKDSDEEVHERAHLFSLFGQDCFEPCE
jgi:hypothetical protein